MARHKRDLGARKTVRRGELIGARYVTAKELRQGLPPVDPKSREIFVD